MGIDVKTQLNENSEPDIFRTEYEVLVPTICLNSGMDKAILKRSYWLFMVEVKRALNDSFAITVGVWTRLFR